MIKSLLPQVLAREETDTELKLRLAIDADLPFFEGHFPGQSVLPGVTQLDWAVRFGCEHFGYDASVASLEVLKFQQLMLPGTEVDLLISNNAAKGKLTFAYSDGERRFGSGRIVIAAHGDS